MRLRFHCQTAAATLTRAQPVNNVVRTALQALAAVLGGAQSLHTNGLDEAYAIPSEHAMKVALRTQQIIAEETHITDVVDPLGGSWYMEALTNNLERAIWEELERIDRLGGTVRAIEEGYFQGQQADFAYEVARRKASGEDVVVGVNKYIDPVEDQRVEVHRVDPEAERRQVERLRRVRAERDAGRVARALKELQEAARDPDENLMPPTMEVVRARASMGEIVAALRDIYGTYQERPTF